jgi:hypothetical protein
MPHTTRGNPENGMANMTPATAGLSDDARLRGTTVMLAGPRIAPVHCAAGSDGETNFGVTSLAAPKAA